MTWKIRVDTAWYSWKVHVHFMFTSTSVMFCKVHIHRLPNDVNDWAVRINILKDSHAVIRTINYMLWKVHIASYEHHLPNILKGSRARYLYLLVCRTSASRDLHTDVKGSHVRHLPNVEKGSHAHHAPSTNAMKKVYWHNITSYCRKEIILNRSCVCVLCQTYANEQGFFL